MQLKRPACQVFCDVDGDFLDQAYRGNRLAVVMMAREAAALLRQLFVLPDEKLEALVGNLMDLDPYGTDPDRAFGWIRNQKGRPARTDPDEATRRLSLAKLSGERAKSIRFASLDNLVPLEWLASVLDEIYKGASPNAALKWGRCTSGRPRSESPFLATSVRMEVAWLIRHGLSKSAACTLVGEGFDSLSLAAKNLIHASDELTTYMKSSGNMAPLSIKRVEEVCASLDPTDAVKQDYFPIYVRG